MEPIWLRSDVILALHEQLISEFGGALGLRDEGLLESALARPKNLYAYTEANVVELAASYAFGLVRNHAFLDGNKRIGFTAAAVFLDINGYTLSATEVDVVVQTLALATGELSEAGYADWLGKNSTRV